MAGLLPLALCLAAAPSAAARMDADAAAGRPLVAHVHVALADNAHQGISPVRPARLGEGRSPRANLYWGALYGVDRYLPRNGWTRRPTPPGPLPDGVLARAVFTQGGLRAGRTVTWVVVADAWAGDRIQDTTAAFLRHAAGLDSVALRVPGVGPLEAGGQAHVVAYVGHNGLMDFEVPDPDPAPSAPARAAVVLACASQPYFQARLEALGAQPLLLTTNLMAPEAYTLDAALVAWFGGGAPAQVHEAAAAAYARYQRRLSLPRARRLFATVPRPGPDR
ncbi:MAG: hypothetical protein H6730_04285 [Deltaproteobacteria bacterium]|nr:hypothetical protein [Deltaproteobacteria bacterium]